MIDVGDPLRRPDAADLPGIERRTARPLDPVRAGQLADDKQMPDVRLPPTVHREPAVAVLGTDACLQRLCVEIDAAAGVEIDARRVHVSEPFDRRGLGRAGLLEVLASLGP